MNTCNQSASPHNTDNTDPSHHQIPNLTLKHFQLTDQEEETLQELKKLSINYNILKVAAVEHSEVLIDFQTYFSLSKNLQAPECSNIIYLKVLDKKCDDKETLLSVVNDVYEEFILGQKKEWILLEGDQATYERLQSIKNRIQQCSVVDDPLSWGLAFFEEFSRSID